MPETFKAELLASETRGTGLPFLFKESETKTKIKPMIFDPSAMRMKKQSETRKLKLLNTTNKQLRRHISRLKNREFYNTKERKKWKKEGRCNTPLICKTR